MHILRLRLDAAFIGYLILMTTFLKTRDVMCKLSISYSATFSSRLWRGLRRGLRRMRFGQLGQWGQCPTRRGLDRIGCFFTRLIWVLRMVTYFVLNWRVREIAVVYFLSTNGC